MTPAPGMLIAGKYRLVRPLASGGMGSVWIAEHADLEVEVAVKFMAERALRNDLSRQRFKREARAAAKLKSPHVTQIHDYGIFEGTPYIAMELLEGESLEALTSRRGALPLGEVVEVVKQLCLGLKLAHDKGIIHRDLKPSNVFLARAGDHEVVKILDFGVAKERDPRLVVGEETATGALVGSPRYMSPEQATGMDLDHRTDLWSLGVVIYEMLAGRRPFRQQHLGQLINAICTTEVASPRGEVTSLPPAIDEFFAKAMARRPDDRFQNAAELARALEAVHSGRPLNEAMSGERSGVEGRLDETGDMPSDVRTGERRQASGRTAFDKTVPAPQDGTSPGVGLDSSARDHAGSRRWILVAAAVAAVAAAGIVIVQQNDGEAPAPSAAPAAPSAPPRAPVAPAPSPEVEAEPPPPAEPSAPKPAPVLKPPPAPKPPAVVKTPPKTPIPATSVKIEDEFGLPVRKK